MLILPPMDPAERPGDRRVRRRRSAAADDRGAAGAFTPETVAAPDAAEPVIERMKPRNPGRRKGDRQNAEQQAGAQSSPRSGRPHAPLVAQLIATVLGVEQTRVKRRGTPEEAAALYARRTERIKRRGEA